MTMGYAVYEDRAARDLGVERWAGYGVPAVCDVAGCEVKIDRGMGYRCEEYTTYTYYDAEGNPCNDADDWAEECEMQEQGCGLHFCEHHLEHGSGHREDVVPKPDTQEWVRFILSDESWADWRDENSYRVAAYEAALPEEGVRTHEHS